MTVPGTDHELLDDVDSDPESSAHADEGELSHLAHLLRSRREQWRPRMSRFRASQLSGVNVSNIEAWETGRVAKPPIHDVMRLAHVLLITPRELQQAVLADRPLPEGAGDAAPRGWLLLERAMELLDWDEHDVVVTVGTTPERVRALREGRSRPTMLETLALAMVLAAYPDGLGDAGDEDVIALLEQLRS